MEISGKTKIVALFGYPIAHTFSPAMHNAAFQALGLEYLYLPFAIKPSHLTEALHSIVCLDMLGANITIPHKEKAMAIIDELSPTAALMGAVNTIINKEQKLIGYNTDGRGFILAMEKELGLSPKNKSVLLLGAGGAAKAIAIALAQEGVNQLVIVNRTQPKAEALAQQINDNYPECHCNAFPLQQKVIHSSEIIINATAVGMKADDPELLKPDWLLPKHLVCDIVYNPVRTKLLRQAIQRGAATLPGWGMLLYQGVLAFELWTGRQAPVTVMKEALRLQLAKLSPG